MFRGYLLSSFMFLYSMFFIKRKFLQFKSVGLEPEKESSQNPDVEEEDWGQFIDIEICC